MRRRDIPELPEPENVRGPYGRAIAIAMVLGAFVAATVGYFEARATQRGGLASADAAELATEATRVSARDQERALSKLLAASTLAEQQVRRANALRLAARPSTSAAERAAARREARRLAALAAGTKALVADPIASDPERQPGQVLAGSSFNADRSWGLHDAARREAGAWGGHVSKYAAILTILAIALYLLGLSLTFVDRWRVFFAGLGVALLLVGGGWGAWEARAAPERASDEAASHYALARRFLAVGDYEHAREHFKDAHGLRRDFGQAAHGHATAIFLDETSQLGAQYPSLVPAEALKEASESLDEALDAGLTTYGVIATLGFYRFLGALESDDPFLLRESIDLTREATEILRRDPAAYYNLGVAQLAYGDPAAADRAYRRALELTLQSPGTPYELVAGALTDLTLLEGEVDEEAVRQHARALKARIVGTIATGAFAPRRPRVRVASAQLAVSPAGVRWSARFRPAAPTGTIWVQWYRYDEQEDGWGAIAAVSGPVEPQEETGGGYGGEVLLSAMAGEPCLAYGLYRAELYVDGTLASTFETSLENPSDGDEEDEALVAAVDRLLSTSLCLPETWRRADDVFVLGLGAAYLAPGDQSGIFVERSSGPVGETFARLASRADGTTVEQAITTGDGSWIFAVGFGPAGDKALLDEIVGTIADHEPVSE